MESLEPRVLGYSQGESVLWTKFLQLGQDAVGDRRDTLIISTLGHHVSVEPGGSTRKAETRTFRHQTVHHALHELDLVLNRKVDKVGIDQDTERGSEVGVVRQEQGGGDLRSVG